MSDAEGPCRVCAKKKVEVERAGRSRRASVVRAGPGSRSAAELDEAVESQLEQSVLKGQAFRWTNEEAREKYGSKLMIASLGAMVKSGGERHGRPKDPTPV